MKNISPSNQLSQPTIISFVKDLPNICSLAGLFCAILGSYFAILQHFHIAMIGLIWAVVFDWGDGMIARRISGRTDYQKSYGQQLDSLIDIINFGVFPTIFLLSYANLNPWFLPGAFFILGSCAVRLSYFNVFGLSDGKNYIGLNLDNNGIIFSFVFLLEVFFYQNIFSIILYIVLVILAALNLSPIRVPKISEKWFFLLVIYSIIVTLMYSWIHIQK
ncbi:CDP-alcohol phosphatidyltransferase family protein [Bacteriovoracaceae bacterium]|nr:CDP-alcohol phosphatidyltransferase family protein [Bacteriovoracaceae bacterium]